MSCEDSPPYPKNITELCNEVQLNIDNLSLSCAFCKKTLSLGDKWLMLIKELCIVWQHKFPFGACSDCLFLHLKIRRLRHHQYSCSASKVEELTGKTLLQTPMRCLRCGSNFGYGDYRKAVAHDRYFFLCFDKWFGICGCCGAREDTEEENNSSDEEEEIIV